MFSFRLSNFLKTAATVALVCATSLTSHSGSSSPEFMVELQKLVRRDTKVEIILTQQRMHRQGRSGCAARAPGWAAERQEGELHRRARPMLSPRCSSNANTVYGPGKILGTLVMVLEEVEENRRVKEAK
ncbi:hypothetical protein BKA93DRAFT_116686 [Sparassis latifolia]